MNNIFFYNENTIFCADKIRIYLNTVWFYLNGYEVYRYFGKNEKETQKKFNEIKKEILENKRTIQL